jgi:hypothetical protein
VDRNGFRLSLDQDAGRKRRINPADPEEENMLMGYHAQDKIGCKLAAGEVVLTSTGAMTTPFPKIDLTTNRKAQNTVANVDAWLIQNAIEEAKRRVDRFNLRQFEGITRKPSQSDKDSAELYLFMEER